MGKPLIEWPPGTPCRKFIARQCNKQACARVPITEAAMSTAPAFDVTGKRLAEESVLARYDLSMEQFLLSRQSLGDSLFERLWEQIARVEIGCELLVCGFDDTAHIFCVSNPTAENPSFITYHDSPGFAAIGTGSYLAESTLYAYRQNLVTGVNETIYNTTVAKFVAESASDVGEHTVLLAFDESGDRLHYEFGLEEKLRARWLTKGKPKAPADALQIIADAIKEAEALPATPSAPQTSEPEQ